MQNSVDIPTMYSYKDGSNLPWNNTLYQPVPEYLGKGPEPNYKMRHVTRRGYFLQSQLKEAKNTPGPTHYETKTLFDQENNKKFGQKFKVNPRAKKGTYLYILVAQGKKNKVGVGSYNLVKS